MGDVNLEVKLNNLDKRVTKIEDSDVGGKFQFSTEEQKTNLKWIDGKEIYCKTYTINESTSNITMPTDIDRIITYDGMRFWNNTFVNGYRVPYYVNDTDYVYIHFNNGSMLISRGSSSVITDMFITVYYTKK